MSLISLDLITFLHKGSKKGANMITILPPGLAYNIMAPANCKNLIKPIKEDFGFFYTADVYCVWTSLGNLFECDYLLVRVI